MSSNSDLIEKLEQNHELNFDEWVRLISSHTEEDSRIAADKARACAISNFSNKIYFRGIIEFSNYCKNDCLYCGIRKSNLSAERYRLSDDEILECCKEGYETGYRTFVLQSGEDFYYNDDRLVSLVSKIKNDYPDCAVTLSVGERTLTSYKKLFDAGATRYLLRHETADKNHYSSIHPKEMSFDNRINCLYELKDIGYQTGCGFMVGTPYQTDICLAEDMMFMQKFNPQMVGIGPFIPHSDTPFRNCPKGSVSKTLFMLSLTRLMLPRVLLPSTTALGTAEKTGRQEGVLCGCNVVMPNLSPLSVRKKYMLYNGKVGTSMSAKDGFENLKSQMEEINYKVIVSRGDYTEENND